MNGARELAANSHSLAPSVAAPFSHRIYWRRKLAGATGTGGILPDYARTRPAAGGRERVPFSLPARTSAQVERIAGASALSTFVILLAGAKVWLRQYAGTSDLLVMAPPYPDGKTHEPVPLRTNLSGDLTFREIVLRVRRTVAEAYAHQDFPVEAGPGTAPLALVFDGLHDRECAGQCDLLFSFRRGATGIDGAIVYDAALFKLETIRRLAEQYLYLQDLLTARPQERLSGLELVSTEERNQLLGAFNPRRRNHYPLHESLDQLFQEQAARGPKRIAAGEGNRAICYGELNQRANRLARFLRRLGAEPNQFVGIYAARGIDFLIGMLGVLKAGSAYLPIDPDYPEERVRFMVGNSQIRTLLVSQALRGSFLQGRADDSLERLVLLDGSTGLSAPEKERSILIHPAADWDAESSDNLSSVNAPSDLAYLLYTSGSTGRPKGAMIRHDGAINHIYAQFEALGFHRDSAFLQSAPSSSDISVWQFLAPLLIGGRTVIADRETVCDPAALFDLIRAEKVTVIELVPLILNELLAHVESLPAEERKLPALEHAMVTGEAVSAPLVNRWFNLYPGIPLVNAYGPTEASDDICQSVLTRPLPAEQRSVPIGSPLANLALYILDRNLQLLPIGAPGEICVSGIGVGAGYWRDEEKTAASFVANPYAGDGRGAVLYRTGDLGRWDGDGAIEFLGRSDDQVKVRGYRIELGEVEAALRECPGVSDAAVSLEEEAGGSKKLAAYLVRSVCQNGGPSSEWLLKLRAFLASRLPDFMMPAAFVIMESLPRTANGKVDRRKLPAAEGAAEIHVPPRTPVETLLAEVWAEVLRRERVGIHDNFFAIGGDSIQSIQVVARARQKGVKLTVRQIFENQTIAGLAGLAGVGESAMAEQGAVAGPVPLTPIQHWFFQEEFPEPHHYNQSVLLETGLGVKAEWLRQAMVKLVEHHDALRLRFRRDAAGWTQSLGSSDNPAEHLAFSDIDLAGLPAAEQAARLESRAAAEQTALDPGEGKLTRVTFFQRGEGEPGRLLIVIHHLAVDGVSWRVLLSDLELAYKQLERGEAIRLPPKSSSFKQWSERLSGQAERMTASGEAEHWLAQPGRAIDRLPRDFAGGASTEARAAHRVASLGTIETELLLRQIPAAFSAGVNEVLLTAMMRAFADWTGRRSLRLDLEGHGRQELFNDIDLSHTVGWFTALFPVVLDLGTRADPADQVKAIREQLRSIPREGIGYGALRYLSPDPEVRSRFAALPRSEVCFNYLGQFDDLFSGSMFLRQAAERPGPERSPLGKLSYLLEINAMVVGGCLKIDWTYDRDSHRPETIDRLAGNMAEALRTFLRPRAEALNGNARYEPSQFPAARLSADKLNAFIGRLKARGQK